MGYRSDVSIIFYAVDTDKLPLPALKLWFEENYPHRQAEDEWSAKVTIAHDYAAVDYVDVKWYADYEHVRAVNDAILKFRHTFQTDTHDYAGYEFIRIGEETSDIEEERSDYCQYRMDVHRTIIYN